MKWILILLLMTSCGATHYLKKAERSLKKAEQLGATVKRDTTMVKLRVDGPSADFKLGDIVFQRSEFSYERPVLKDTIIYKNKIKLQVKDSLVYVDCPEIEKEVPVAVNTEISSGHSTWDLVILAIVALVVGCVIGRILK